MNGTAAVGTSSTLKCLQQQQQQIKIYYSSDVIRLEIDKIVGGIISLFIQLYTSNLTVVISQPLEQHGSNVVHGGHNLSWKVWWWII